MTRSPFNTIFVVVSHSYSTVLCNKEYLYTGSILNHDCLGLFPCLRGAKVRLQSLHGNYQTYQGLWYTVPYCTQYRNGIKHKAGEKLVAAVFSYHQSNNDISEARTLGPQFQGRFLYASYLLCYLALRDK